jgi:DnaJ-class molecular chaperone
MRAKDYYKILEASETATAAELKKAFRKIARDSHPDRNPGDKVAEERFKEASEAYEILSNPEKRKKYDALRKYGFGEAGFGPGGFRGGPEGFPGGTHIRFETGDLQDFDFADIFTEGSPFSGFFDQLFQQAGAGGSRVRGGRRARPQGPFYQSPHTNGRGPTVDDPFFRQDGLDVHCTVWLKLEQLEKGAKVKVRTPSGKKALVKVPANTKIGSVLRLPGLGLASGDRKGDQYVHVEAVA